MVATDMERRPMNGMHTRIAAGLTLVALGGFAGYAVNGSASNAPARSTGSEASQPVEIRTQTIRRTVRVVKHEKPKRPPHAVSSPALAPRAAAAAPASRAPTAVAAAPPAPVRVTRTPSVAPQSAPVRTRTSGSAHHTTTTTTHRPVTTRTSGAGGGKSGGGEHEHEGGGDD
jgi:hypothetical protein